MCNLYRNDPTLVQWADDFEKLLGLTLQLDAGPDTLSNQPWRKEVYPRYQGLFARPRDATDLSAGLEPAVGRWGLVPFFHKGPVKDFKASTNNCRSEEMHAKPMFRDTVKARRCIIPATHINEWTGPTGSKTKHAISMANGSPLFLAGLWASHTWEGERTESYAMVTQAAEPGHDMGPFHNRQPVVLDRDSARVWLNLDADWTCAVQPPPPGTLAFDPPEPAAA